jgi:hypothetical protein
VGHVGKKGMNIEKEKRKKEQIKLKKKEWKERKLGKTTRFEHAGGDEHSLSPSL